MPGPAPDGRVHRHDSIAAHVARVERSYGFNR